MERVGLYFLIAGSLLIIAGITGFVIAMPRILNLLALVLGAGAVVLAVWLRSPRA